MSIWITDNTTGFSVLSPESELEQARKNREISEIERVRRVTEHNDKKREQEEQRAREWALERARRHRVHEAQTGGQSPINPP